MLSGQPGGPRKYPRSGYFLVLYKCIKGKILSNANFVEKVSLRCIIFLLHQRNKTFIVILWKNVGFAYTFCDFMMKIVFRCDVYEKY